MNKQEEIEYWQSKFRILEGYNIEYENKAEYKGQTSLGTKRKRAGIYAYGRKGRVPKDYIFHEIQHICLAEIRKGKGCSKYSVRREKEEFYVQDLCQIFRKHYAVIAQSG